MIILNNWINNIQSFLYPPACLLCGQGCGDDCVDNCGGLGEVNGIDICSACNASLPRLEHACHQCALQLSVHVKHGVCGQCLKLPPSFDRSIAISKYQAPMDRLITQLKFNQRLMVARSLGLLLAQQIKSHADIDNFPSAIIPVPLHHSRLRERGFNQALEIARPIAHHFGLPILKQHVERCRATAMQSSLPKSERQKNIKGVFKVVKELPFKRVAIVDDVMTTGRTVEELSKILRKAGVEQINVWVCARAELG